MDKPIRPIHGTAFYCSKGYQWFYCAIGDVPLTSNWADKGATLKTSRVGWHRDGQGLWHPLSADADARITEEWLCNEVAQRLRKSHG